MSAPASSPTVSSLAEKRLPLTEAQREVWFASQLSENAALAYHESMTLRLRGALNLGALRRALRLLVMRHEALRVRIEADGAAQRILPLAELDVTVDELPANLAVSQREQRAHAWLTEQTRRPFALAESSLFRAAVLRIDAQTHFLSLIVHHVICDGWSLGVMAREVGALYAAELVGKAAKLPPAGTLESFLAEQATPRVLGAQTAAEGYWQKEFAGEIPVLELPTDRPRKAERTFEGALITHELPEEVSSGIKQLCTQRECTVFTALFAAFSVLLHRLTGGGEELVVGVPSAGQVMAGFGTLVGHFANLLPIRTRTPANLAFGEFLLRVRQNLTTAMEHWRYPFGSLLRHLNIARDASRVPVAPVVFNTTGAHRPLEFGGLIAEPENAPKSFVNFDLNFHFGLRGERITLGCYYSTELFDRATVERWLSHFETLLRGIVANPDAALSKLPLLTEAEQHRILREWNDTALDYRRDATLHQLFAEQVQRSPEATAVVAGSERWTYAELDRRSTAVAAALQTRGVGPDSLVGIFLERTAQLPAAMLGVLKSGGAYVPLDLSHPPQRLGFIIDDTGMQVIVTQRALRDALPATTVPIICVEDLGGGQGGVLREVATTASHLAYVIYTSGSTGQPKGVCLEHRGVVALTAWARRQYRAEELDGVLFATNATFDVSVFESLVPLCLGGKIIVADNILALNSTPARHEVRLVSGVPSAVAELVRAGHLPSSVMTVNVAGEPCAQSLVEALYALPHVQRVIDVYGPTETTVYSTGSQRRAGGRPTIGRPLPNERAYILDTHLRPVPVGVRGELFIGGEKLARGYLNRPELTAERFIASPFEPGERLYRTGDGARFMPDGTIEFLGRLDHQVKIRGYRIELGEIEAALLEHATVKEAVVVALTEATGTRLVAYVVSAAGHQATVEALRSHLAQRLPDYMVPAQIVVLQELPRTTSGKVDRRSLPKPSFTTEPQAFVAPRNTSEEVMLSIWREVLQRDDISVAANFFELGGHSLLAAQVLARVHELFGVDLTLRSFFQNPTIAALASATERALVDDIQRRAGAETNPASAAAL
jgi:amino acid adenylation domain-containing protein